MKPPLWFIFLFIIIACSACSTLSQKIHPTTKLSKTAESESLLYELRHRNDSLKAFKGTGKVNIVKSGTSFTSRVAWAGSAPEKLRIELIGSPGQPKIGFSSDGQWLYYYDHKDKSRPVKRIAAHDASLRRFTSIPITSGDVISMLSGRIPGYEYHSSEIKKTKSTGEQVLVLHKKWWMGSQKIYLTANKQKIEKIEVYFGSVLIYRVEVLGEQSAKSYRIPKRLIFTNSDGDRFQLDIKRFWADAAVSPEMFILKSPNP